MYASIVSWVVLKPVEHVCDLHKGNGTDYNCTFIFQLRNYTVRLQKLKTLKYPEAEADVFCL